MRLNEIGFGKSDIYNVVSKNSNLFTFGFEAEMILSDAMDEDLLYHVSDNYEDVFIDLEEYPNIHNFLNKLPISDKYKNKIEQLYNDYDYKNSEEFIDYYGKELFCKDFLKELNHPYIMHGQLNYIIKTEEKTPIDIKNIDTSIIRNIQSSYIDKFDTNYKIQSITGHYIDKKYDTYYFDSDTSLNPDYYTDLGMEIISPIIKNYDDFISEIQTTFSFINNCGYTNDSTGFHINIGTNFDKNKINIIKAYLLSSPSYFLNIFDRETNNFCKEIISNISNESKRDILNEPTMNDQINSFIEYINNDLKGHATAINMEKLSHFEIRIAGGYDYQNKFEKIKQIIDRFIYVFKISTSSEYDNDYKKKLYKIITEWKESPNRYINTKIITHENEILNSIDNKEIKEKAKVILYKDDFDYSLINLIFTFIKNDYINKDTFSIIKKYKNYYSNYISKHPFMKKNIRNFYNSYSEKNKKILKYFFNSFDISEKNQNFDY